MAKHSWALRSRVSRRRLIAGLGASGAGAMLAACGAKTGSSGTTAPSQPAAASKPIRGGTLTLGLMNDVANLDPLKSSLVVDRRVHYQIYDSLISTDNTLKLLPGLAVSWETSEPTTLVFKLRQGVKFHDGSVFNADAVKFNLDRILQTAASPRNAEIAGVETVTSVDANTVKLTLKTPFSPLLAQLVDRAGMIVSPAAVQKLGDDLTRGPIGAGTGAFKFVEYKKDDHVTLAQNENYWRKDDAGGALPYLDKLILRPIVDETQRLNSLKSGEIDFSDEVPSKDVESIKKDPTLIYSQVPALSFNGFYLNISHEVFKDVRVRQALAWSIDRQQILDTVYFKIPVLSNGPIAPPQFAYDPGYKPFTRDIAKAKALLAAAGKSSVTFTLLITANSPVNQQLAELLKDQAKESGFAVNIQALDFPTIVAMLTKHDFQAAIAGWSGRLDPDGNTYGQFHTGAGNNYSVYTSPAMDKALEDARQTYDQDKRKALYQQVNKLAAEDVPYVFLYHSVTGQYSTTKVKHFTAVPDAIYRFVDVWKQA